MSEPNHDQQFDRIFSRLRADLARVAEAAPRHPGPGRGGWFDPILRWQEAQRKGRDGSVRSRAGTEPRSRGFTQGREPIDPKMGR